MDAKQFKLEEERLKETIKEFNETIEYYGLKVKAIPKIYANNTQMLDNMLTLYTEKLELMEKNIGKPYFARIDFKRDLENKVEEVYIGKVGIINEDNKIITVDWRAPICSMYYDENLGRASYTAPEGKCTGNLLIKRQFDIENSQLKSYQDVDTVSNDELLKPYLASSADNRLKNIVTTIQKEQNSIIREPIGKNIVVQGVAGSGKTTVALHRIAYLVYTYKERIKPEQYMVIGSNDFFVDYISGVLPDLDVNNVMQLTYEKLCSDFIGEKIHVVNEEKNLLLSISNDKEIQYKRLKVSMKYKEALDKFIEKIDKNICNDKKIIIKDYEIISNDTIKDIYYSIKNNVIYTSIYQKIEKAKLLLKKYIEDNQEDITEKLKEECNEKINKLNSDRIIELSKIEYIEKEMEKNCNNNIKKLFNNKTYKIIDTYCDFLNNIDEFMELDTTTKSKLISDIPEIKKGKIDFEDISALIYLNCKIVGIGNYKKYKHIAIDEAQDYGNFSFYALKQMLPEATFSIFGDLAQSIYQYRGINTWNDVIDETFNKDCKLKLLLKSYRTTTEIMNCANNITKRLKIEPAQPVIRHGEEVEYISFNNDDEQIKMIKDIINEYKAKGFKSIAIICKDDNEANNINTKINNKEVKNIISSENKYEGGICTIASHLAKGLEFDAVIIANASEKIYNPNKTIDMKLLYVSMTRPLHQLKILFKGGESTLKE